MGWFVRVSRFNTLHMVHGQEGGTTCAFACAAMINYIVKKDYVGAGQTLSDMLSYVPVVGSRMANFVQQASIAQICEADARRAYDLAKLPAPEAGGVTPDALASLLSALGCGTWRSVKYDPGGLRYHIRKQRNRTPAWPMVLGVRWGDGQYHWVVCDRYVEAPGIDTDEDVTWAILSDPWDGDVRATVVERDVTPDYCPGPSQGWFWESRFLYDSKRTGWLTGRMIVRE